MNIAWDKEKNSWLKVNRAVSFEEISDMLTKGQYLDILENPSRDNQLFFVLRIRSYTWVVPFLIDDNERIVLKTAFPSRKMHRKYGDDHG